MSIEQQYQDEIDGLREELRRVEALIETEKRKAFFAGRKIKQFPNGHNLTDEDAYRAYTEATKEIK